MKLSWETKKVKVKDLKILKINPRKITKKQKESLKKSLEKFNLAEIPAVNQDLTIIGGNQRVDSLISLGKGDEYIDVRVPNRNLTEKEVKEYVLISNTHAGVFDVEVLGLEFNDIKIDFSIPELNKIQKSQANEDNYHISPDLETDIKEGDLFQVGKHRLMCGDSTEIKNINKLVNKSKVDMVFTDPDFSMAIEDVYKCFENTKKTMDKYFGFWIASDKMVVNLTNKYFDIFSHFFIHDFKMATMTSGSQAMQQHTLIAKFGNLRMNNLKDGFTTIIKSATERTSKTHKLTPMSKKIELPFKFIEHYTQKENIVLDVFGHSGSTMIACEQLDRKCFMMELIPKYCQVVINRIKESFPGIIIKKIT